MAISFQCECGKPLRARDELAGKKTKCPGCGAVLSIPPAVVDPDFSDGLPYGLDEPDPPPKPAFGSAFEDEMEVPPLTYHPVASQPKREEDWPRPASTRPAAQSTTDQPKKSDSKSSLREYTYLLLIFALAPLILSHFMGEKDEDGDDRIVRTLEKVKPEDQERVVQILMNDNATRTQQLSALPDGRLDGALLSHDSMIHWVYAGIATVGFLLILMLFFSVERVNPLHLLGIGLFTGTVGIVLLLLVQYASQFRFQRVGRGVIAILLLILMFIGWSYQSASDPGSNFWLSAFGFTFGVGLCEELCKALPLFFYFKRHANMGWRGACLWGLASGIGFGVSEGIMYSAEMYNGVAGVDAYLVRFISCVALHAMWAGSVGIAIARNVDAYEAVEDGWRFALFMLRVLAVPMLLHGFYDTLLKKDMEIWALVVAVASFAWLAVQIELARGANPEAGTGRKSKKKYAF